MSNFFIYQFSCENGSKETIILQTEKLSLEELIEKTPAGTELDQILECNAIIGDPDILPNDRQLIVRSL